MTEQTAPYGSGAATTGAAAPGSPATAGATAAPRRPQSLGDGDGRVTQRSHRTPPANEEVPRLIE